MKALIVDDDFTSRLLLQETLKEYCHVHAAVNGREAVDAVRIALESGAPYDLICLDIQMPEMEGQEGLKRIRELEASHGFPFPNGSKIVMTTALADRSTVLESMKYQCDYYLAKPIERRKLLDELRRMRLIV